MPNYRRSATTSTTASPRPSLKPVPRLNDNATAGTRIQFIYAESQLTAVEIYHGNQSHWLRRYALDATSLFIDNRNPATGGGSACHSLDNDGSWGGYTHMRTLNAVWEEGWDKTNNRTVSLPATRFSYTTLRHLYYNSTNCMLYKYLSGVENGYGGRVEFGYSSDGRGIWDNGHKYLKAQNNTWSTKPPNMTAETHGW
ncbi:MAG: hypothetical protein M5U34_18195 [Chloroflexi bacterium]|nr:hypothetical protein [Chloroflexota bacterium]